MASSPDPAAVTPDDDERMAEGPQTAIRGGAVRVAGYGVGVLVSLGSATILLRHLGIAGFGRYVTVTSLVALVGGVTEAGIVVYGIREFVSRRDAERRELIANLLAMRLALALAGVLIAVCFGLAVGYVSVIVVGTVVAGAGLLAQVVADVLSIPLQAQLLLGRVTGAELTRRVLALCFIAALALAGAGVVPLLAASALAAALAVPLLVWMSRRYLRFQLSFDLGTWRSLFGEALPYAVALSLTGVYVYVTVIIMSLIASATQTGLFATSFRVTQVLLAVPALLLTAVFPLLSRETPEMLRESFGRVIWVAVICGVWMALTLALGAGFIIDVLAESKGRAAVPVLRIHGLMLIATFVSTSSALVLVSLRRYRPLIVTSVSVFALDVALAFALVPALGAKGGALADVIAEAVAAILLTAGALRAIGGVRIDFSSVPVLVIAAGAAAAVALLPIGSLPQAVVATIVYFSILVLAGALPRQVTDAALRLGSVLPVRGRHPGAR